MPTREIIRLLHPYHYSETKQRYKSSAFSKSSKDGGVSVVDLDCIRQGTKSICDHITEFYPESIAGNPPIFWRFTDAILPTNTKLVQKTSKFGDVCHHNIDNMSKAECKSFLKGHTLLEFEICDSGAPRTVTEHDIIIQRRALGLTAQD